MGLLYSFALLIAIKNGPKHPYVLIAAPLGHLT